MQLRMVEFIEELDAKLLQALFQLFDRPFVAGYRFRGEDYVVAWL